MAYKKLALKLLVSVIIMYGVMFLNVDERSHVYFSLTRLYMSILMVAPMALLMLLGMGKLYPDRKKNLIIGFSSIVIFATALICLRTQTPISDIQYMKAMIPHHSSAILTSKHANIKDPEVRKLADSIIASQEREIAQMKQILNRLQQ